MDTSIKGNDVKTLKVMVRIGYRFWILFLFGSISCENERSVHKSQKESIIQYPESSGDNPFNNPTDNLIKTKIELPAGYSRIEILDNTYDSYLRHLPLKPSDSKVKLFNDQLKFNQDAHVAVIDLPIGNKDLHQCADAIMRLRAEYLWRDKKYDDIHFDFTNGFTVAYAEWMKGKRMIVKGNKTYWDQTNNPTNTYEDFWEYMELIFMYAGTLSLSKELKPILINDMQIGDVFIQGGSPGHAVTIVDMAINDNKQKIFLLAQSYMPAQEMHILKNPKEDISPWYILSDADKIETPEWTFTKDQLMRF